MEIGEILVFIVCSQGNWRIFHGNCTEIEEISEKMRQFSLNFKNEEN